MGTPNRFASVSSVSSTTASRLRRAVVEGLEERRLFAAGGFDPSFDGDGIKGLGTLGPEGAVVDLDVRNGKTVVLLQAQVDEGFGPRPACELVRLTAAGQLDRSFDLDGRLRLGAFAAVAGVVVQPDNKILVTGTLDYLNLSGMVRYNADGSFDTTFDAGPGGGVHLPFDRPTAPRLAPNGKIVVGGYNRATYDTGLLQAARFTPGGTYDRSFGGTGIVTIPAAATGADNGRTTHVAVAPDGRVLLGGSYEDHDTDTGSMVVRLNPDGSVERQLYDTAVGDSD